MADSLEIAFARLEEKVKAMENAQKLQAKEYARRLNELNHAHEQAREVLGTYLPRETWEAWTKDEGIRREKLDDELADISSQANAAQVAAVAVSASNAKNIAIA